MKDKKEINNRIDKLADKYIHGNYKLDNSKKSACMNTILKLNKLKNGIGISLSISEMKEINKIYNDLYKLLYNEYADLNKNE